MDIKPFIKLLSIYSAIILLFVVISPIGSTKAIETSPVIDLSTTPSERVMDIKNFKPGDYAIRTLTVNNDGSEKVNYRMTALLKSGSEKFYDQLQFQVRKDEKLLYEGSLGSFEGFEPRELPADDREDLQIRVDFPWESGNEFQGLATEVVFQFTAETDINPDQPTTETPETPTDGSTDQTSQPEAEPAMANADDSLPQTGEESPMLFYLFGGLLLAGGVALFATNKWVRNRKE
ncbi:LPXTG cell wall anchor domain-containing protein [Thalassobacillus sp. CUG 92003]|uniref:LPXTG cell wall anchor domain-containing protein n=1 Tax=Thalassobacillus sp. CUG 92003 TaxID=2736641 RepID=UPI0015E6870E|nr:LPXTG cell wall anchor domain-containing protein [Thalassobacillus sp. CUG 92003]